MTARRMWAAAAGSLALLGGCLGAALPATEVPLPEPAEAVADPAGGARPDAAPVVVALLDSGVNPYHEAFRDPARTRDPATYLAGYPQGVQALHLALGAASYEAAVEADAAIWEGGLARRVPAWIPGTRIVAAISFGEFDTAEQRPILDDHRHGTATASVVAAANPGILLCIVEAPPGGLGEAVDWIAQQPWIDLVSISVGALGNAPVGTGVAERTARLAEAGMVVIVGAGNDPTLAATDEHDGPPWVVSVGGAMPGASGDVLVASKGADVVSAYRLPTALHNHTTAWRSRSGTSFAAPHVAGTLAAALQDIRAEVAAPGGRGGGPLVAAPGPGLLADGALTAAELREVMNRTAAYWKTAAWFPEGPEATLPPEPLPTADGALRATVPVGPAPWAQMGWGFVEPGQASLLAARALGAPMPAKPDAAAAHMAALAEARCALWCDAASR